MKRWLASLLIALFIGGPIIIEEKGCVGPVTIGGIKRGCDYYTHRPHFIDGHRSRGF